MPRVSTVAAGEDGFFGGAEVFADDADDADGGEVAGGEREVSGGTADAAVTAAGWGFNGVERDAAYDKNRQSMILPGYLRYFPMRRSSFSRAAAWNGVAAGEQSVLQSGCAGAGAFGGHGGYGGFDDHAGVGRVLMEDGDDLFDGDVVVACDASNRSR